MVDGALLMISPTSLAALITTSIPTGPAGAEEGTGAGAEAEVGTRTGARSHNVSPTTQSSTAFFDASFFRFSIASVSTHTTYPARNRQAHL